MLTFLLEKYLKKISILVKDYEIQAIPFRQFKG